MSTGNIVEIIGAVVDVEFPRGSVPKVYDALHIDEGGLTLEVQQLIPVSGEADTEQLKTHWDYIYEPDSVPVMDALMIRYIESLVYQGVVENVACEMAARMIAMKAATDNAGDLINELQLVYNKARQAAITQEISEIVSGAAAV